MHSTDGQLVGFIEPKKTVRLGPTHIPGKPVARKSGIRYGREHLLHIEVFNVISGKAFVCIVMVLFLAAQTATKSVIFFQRSDVRTPGCPQIGWYLSDVLPAICCLFFWKQACRVLVNLTASASRYS